MQSYKGILYYLATKGNKLLIHIMTLMNIKIIILNNKKKPDLKAYILCG